MISRIVLVAATLFAPAASLLLPTAPVRPASPSVSALSPSKGNLEASGDAGDAEGFEDIGAILARIERERDEVPLELIDELRALGTRAGAEALIEAYGSFSSILMRREVVNALARFDGIAEAEQIALQKIADVAVDSKASELRDGAVDALGGCPSLGRFFLRNLVESNTRSGVRERAMERHVETSTGDADDLDWYALLFEGKVDSDKKKARDTGIPLKGRPLTKVRELALTQIAPGLKDNRLVDIAQEKRRDMTAPSLAGIRRIALAELVGRGSKKGKTVAEDVFKDVTEPAENRVAAARHLFELSGTKMAGRFLSEGDRDRSVVPMALRMAMAEMLAEMDHASTDKKLVGLLKKAEDETILFCLRALQGVQDDRLSAELLRLIENKYQSVRVAAVEALGAGAASDPADSIEALGGMLESETEQRVLVAVLRALGQLRAEDAEWSSTLVALTDDSRIELRNASLEALHEATGTERLDVFEGALAHEEWSTRVTALGILSEMRTREATGLIIARMVDEPDFMLDRFADALWSLSGQPFRRSADRWSRWWDDVGAEFEPITEERLAELTAEEERRRLLESSKAAAFFGLRVESKRVLFVLDVSGSMNFTLSGEELDEDDQDEEEAAPAIRMEVAKEELVAALSDLEADTLFNLITFSSGVDYWKRDGIVAATPSTKEEAVEYVGRLGAGGGTNLYGALRMAFEDRDVDTIFVLSDGEPAGGRIDDPYVIREEVFAWNEHRHVTIHTVAIGADLGILEWLAEDSGGWYVKYE